MINQKVTRRSKKYFHFAKVKPKMQDFTVFWYFEYQTSAVIKGIFFQPKFSVVGVYFVGVEFIESINVNLLDLPINVIFAALDWTDGDIWVRIV